MVYTWIQVQTETLFSIMKKKRKKKKKRKQKKKNNRGHCNLGRSMYSLSAFKCYIHVTCLEHPHIQQPNGSLMLLLLRNTKEKKVLM